jgi:hypothetical protein
MGASELFGASRWWEAEWWRANGAMVQGISTGVLVIVTGAYVRVTAKILGSQRAMTSAALGQVRVLEKQLDVSSRAMAESRRDAQQAHKHAELALAENVRARLSGQTPAVTVEVVPLSPVMLMITVKNHGPGPSLIAPGAGGVGSFGIFDEEVLLAAGEQRQPSWSSAETAEALYSQWGDKGLPPITLQSRSPVTGVVDTHSWEGSVRLVQPPGGLGAEAPMIRGPMVAARHRAYPGDEP